MNKLNMYQKMCGWKNVYDELLKEYDEDHVNRIFEQAFDRYNETIKKYSSHKGINRIHVYSAIAEESLYLSLKEVMDSSQAINMLEEAAKPTAIAKHHKIEKLPALLFIKVANLITSTMFSEKAGFKREWIAHSSKELRFNLLTCPYVDTLKDMGCKEVCRVRNS